MAKGACPSCGAENKIFFGSVVGIDVSKILLQNNLFNLIIFGLVVGIDVSDMNNLIN